MSKLVKKMSKKYPKVLIAIPTYDKKEYCLKDLLKALDKLTYPNFDILFCDTSLDDKYYKKLKRLKLNVIKSNYNPEDKRLNLRDGRNGLRIFFLKNKKYKYFLSLEDDNIPPKDLIEKLLKVKMPVVGGWYNLRSKIPSISLKGPFETNNKILLPIFENLPEVFKVFMMGLGCVLIERHVIEKIKFKVAIHYIDSNEANWYDDVFFYLDCQDSNIGCYCVNSLKIPHIINKGEII